MSRDRFVEIMRLLRFDLKTRRRINFLQDEFALVSQLWNSFISNCQKAFILQWAITVDEQLLLCKARCRIIQYMKPGKFGVHYGLQLMLKTNNYTTAFLTLEKIIQGAVPCLCPHMLC